MNNASKTIHRTTIEPMIDCNGIERGGMRCSVGGVAIADLLTKLLRQTGEIASAHNVGLNDFTIETAYFGGVNHELNYIIDYRGTAYDVTILGKRGEIVTAY